MYCNLIWKSPGFISFGADLIHFGPKYDSPDVDTTNFYFWIKWYIPELEEQQHRNSRDLNIRVFRCFSPVKWEGFVVIVIVTIDTGRAAALMFCDKMWGVVAGSCLCTWWVNSIKTHVNTTYTLNDGVTRESYRLASPRMSNDPSDRDVRAGLKLGQIALAPNGQNQGVSR